MDEFVSAVSQALGRSEPSDAVANGKTSELNCDINDDSGLDAEWISSSEND
jgi:hypothetical protein